MAKAEEQDAWDDKDVPAPDWAAEHAPHSDSDRDMLTISIKGGSGTQPWVVGHFNSLGEALDILGDDEWTELMELVETRSTEFQELYGQKAPAKAPAGRGSGSWGKKTSGSSGGSQRSSAGRKGKVEWDEEEGGYYCKHGEAVEKSGKSDKGRSWSGQFCPNKERNDQCDPCWD